MYKERFLNYLDYEKRFSAHTRTAYDMEIQRFLNFVEGEGLRFDEINYRFVRYFVGTLKESGKASSSVNRTISALKSYYKFLVREGLLDNNPALAIKSLRTPKKLPVSVEKEKIVGLLERIESTADTFEERRDYIVMELLFGTGIRLAELLAIKEKDIDIYNKKIRILGKRNKERFVPAHSTLLIEIDRYLTMKKNTFKENICEHLIVTNTGKPAYAKMVYSIVNKYLTMITSQQKRSPHVLRHSFATALLDNGADLNAIKEILGHAGLVATQVYTHNSAERLKTIYKQAHPKA